MKNWKVSWENVVTMATVFSKYLQNTHQKISHKILGKVMKFQPLTKNRFRVVHKKPLGGGGAQSAPRLDRVKIYTAIYCSAYI